LLGYAEPALSAEENPVLKIIQQRSVVPSDDAGRLLSRKEGRPGAFL
jgi:hypothetical protein